MDWSYIRYFWSRLTLWNLYCYWTNHCADCGCKITKFRVSTLTEVCTKCFDEWNGATIEEIISEPLNPQ